MDINEPNAGLRTVNLFLVDSFGNGVAGLTFAPGDGKVQVHEHGGVWANSVNAVVELAGGAAGEYSLELALTEVNTAGPLMYAVNDPAIADFGDWVLVGASGLFKDQATPALRSVAMFIVDTFGNGVGGLVFAAGEVKRHKYGGTWVNVSALPVEAVGGLFGGFYTLTFSLGEVDTYGALGYQAVRLGVIRDFVEAEVVDRVSGGAGALPVFANTFPPNGTVIAPADFVFFEVTCTDGFTLILPEATLDPLLPPEVIYDWELDVFVNGYEGVLTPITNGYRFEIRKARGWPTTPTMKVWAVGTSGTMTIGP